MGTVASYQDNLVWEQESPPAARNIQLDDYLHGATLFVRQNRSAGTSHATKSVRSSAFFNSAQIDNELMSAAGAYSLDQVRNAGPRLLLRCSLRCLRRAVNGIGWSGVCGCTREGV